MTSCLEAMGWGFWDLKKKNSELRFDARGRKLIFGARRGQTCSLRWGAARGGVRWKSQHRKKLCLSLLMSKNLKLKKVNKSFVPEPISCFSDSYICVWTLWTFYACEYLGRIFGRVNVTISRKKALPWKCRTQYAQILINCLLLPKSWQNFQQRWSQV